MSEGKRKKLKSAKELALRGLGLVIILIAVISLYQLGKQAYDLYLVRKETVKSSEKIKAIEKDNERLEEERSNLHDPKYVEKVARDEHNMVGKMKFRSSSWMKRKNRGARLRMGAFFFCFLTGRKASSIGRKGLDGTFQTTV